jgi:DNA-binding MarR family transcriptional regulator/N-acetylglutamate synthase-like GNAT family acetyltransferase
MADAHVDAVRRFNRFYTKQIGILEEGLLGSSFSLTEVRVLYEIAHGPGVGAAELAARLRVDPGYLSRILARFQKRGIVRFESSAADGRRSLLSLTAKGKKTFAGLDARQQREVGALLAQVSPGAWRRLVDAMRIIEQVLGIQTKAEPYLLRVHQPGDMGWVTYRHGVLYSQEYGYDERFEALVAKIVGEFIEQFDPTRERCWIAEKDGEIAGAVFLVKKSATVAKLRLLYVEPSARGMGIGERLIAECIRFARQARYRRITLWTQSELLAARHLYQKAGFELTAEESHQSFGRDDLVAETWELAL